MRFWAGPTVADVRELDPTELEELRDLPLDGPAVLTWRPDGQVSVDSALAELEQVAIRLFPAWLPGAELIEGPGGAGVAAVRSLALRHAAHTADHGPLLADLAERALRRQPTSVVFPPAVRAAGLARVIAAARARPGLALLVYVPMGTSPSVTARMRDECARLATMGRFRVWLVPASVEPPAVVAAPSLPATPLAGQPAPPVVSSRPRAGAPHPGSPAEQALEKALCRQPWTAGREWNQTYRFGPLAGPIRIDLMWTAERVVVEIDGPEHHDALHYQADRRRDVELQLLGFGVLRFTNADVEHDLGAVVARIEQFVHARRAA